MHGTFKTASTTAELCLHLTQIGDQGSLFLSMGLKWRMCNYIIFPVNALMFYLYDAQQRLYYLFFFLLTEQKMKLHSDAAKLSILCPGAFFFFSTISPKSTKAHQVPEAQKQLQQYVKMLL